MLGLARVENTLNLDGSAYVSGMVAWLLDILIGEAVGALPIKWLTTMLPRHHAKDMNRCPGHKNFM